MSNIMGYLKINQSTGAAEFTTKDPGQVAGFDVVRLADADARRTGVSEDVRRAVLASYTPNIGEVIGHLFALCKQEGKVVTIELQPLKPLAMGHYMYVVNLRDAREVAK